MLHTTHKSKIHRQKNRSNVVKPYSAKRHRRLNPQSHVSHLNTPTRSFSTFPNKKPQKKINYYNDDNEDDILSSAPTERPKSQFKRNKPTTRLSHSYTDDNRPHNTRPISPLNKYNYTTLKQLHDFIYQGELQSVKDWLQHRENRIKIDFDSQDGYGSTLLGSAIRRHYYRIVAALLPFCDLNATTSQGPVLFHALQVDDLAIVRALLDYGANPNGVGPESQTALMLAATIPNISSLIALLSHGATLNNQDFSGRTAVMYAASRGLYKNMELLYRCGANMTICDKQGKTALDYFENDISQQKNITPQQIDEMLSTFEQPPSVPITLPQFGRLSNGLLSSPSTSTITKSAYVDFLPAISPYVDEKPIWSPKELQNAITLTSLVNDRRDLSRPLQHVTKEYKDWYRLCRGVVLEDAKERQEVLDKIYLDEKQNGRLRHGKREMVVDDNDKTTNDNKTY